MAEPGVHLEQGRDNEELSRRIQDLGGTTDYRGWVVVTNFYSLIQYVMAILKDDGVPVEQEKGHDTRMKLIMQNSIGHDPGTVRDCYQELKDITDMIRYNCKPVIGDDVETSECNLAIVKEQLEIPRRLETWDDHGL